METTHTLYARDARDLSPVADEAVDLVVTSPPYPMVEMWDDLFTDLDPAVGEALANGKGEEAFEAMHEVLDSVWAEVERVLAPGGIACINVGDATRTLDGPFRVYPNHARVLEAFTALGFDPLPDVLWHKPTNSAAKFMGSGMLPPSAYVTLEHEYVLIFRKGERRTFDPGEPRRYESAFFWEERNRWFTDVWTDVTGRLQDLSSDGVRDRAAAFPFEIPYRLMNMYSVYGDTILDPFWGTGTTTLAAMVAGRHSIGVERDGGLIERFDDEVDSVLDISREVISERLTDHREFLRTRREAGSALEYDAVHYDFSVMTKQERELLLYAATDVSLEKTTEPATYRVSHDPITAGDD